VTAVLVRAFTRATLAALRRDVEDFGARQGLRDRALYRFVVAVNELTTNAVRHGGGAGRLELRRAGDVLQCRVTDEGPGMPPGRRRPPAPAPPRALNGRGLWLARQNADTLDIDSHAAGTTVTITAHLRAA
jgi:anti-sigma regulatory factor (Ser/Thr protein kinase)